MTPPTKGPTRLERPKTAPKNPRYLRARWGEDVADDRKADGEERSRSQALEAAEEDQLPHLLREAGERRPDEEDAHPDDDHDPPAEDVGELPVDRPAGGDRHQVRGEGPGVDVVAVQVGDDPRQGGADDRLVER